MQTRRGKVTELALRGKPIPPQERIGHHLDLTPKIDEDLAPTQVESHLVKATIRDFEAELGGRHAIADILLSLPELTEPQQAILRLVADPEHDSTSLSKLCAQAGITVGQLFQAYKDGALARAHITVLQKVESKIAAATDDLLEHCVQHQIPCPTCLGSGELQKKPTKQIPDPQPYPCYTCRGAGTIPAESSLEHQKVAFEILGLLKKPGGIGVQINQQQINQSGANGVVTPNGHGSTYVALQKLIASASSGFPAPPPIIEAEAAPVEEPAAEVIEAEGAPTVEFPAT